MRVVITHDFLECYGGAERVLAEMAATFPDAPVYAILGRQEVAERAGIGDRFHSLMPQRDALFRNYRLLAPLLPGFVDSSRVPEADVVLSSSYAFAHRLRSRNHAVRVSYCHSPLRFAWSMTEEYGRRWAGGGPSTAAFRAFAAAMRRSDRRSAQEVHTYLTQSRYVGDQIERCYGRGAEVIGVPVDTSRFVPAFGPSGDHFLFCGRLIEPYKKPGLLIEAFRRMPEQRLVIAGDGPAAAELRAAAPPNVEFVGELRDDEMVQALQGCRALVFPSRDDFGLMPVEAMACGRPVIAYGAGGALQTVIPGVTGELFARQTPEAVVDAVRGFRPERFSKLTIRAHAEQWNAAGFRARLRAAVAAAAGVESQPITVTKPARFARTAPAGGEPPSPVPVPTPAAPSEL